MPIDWRTQPDATITNRSDVLLTPASRPSLVLWNKPQLLGSQYVKDNAYTPPYGHAASVIKVDGATYNVVAHGDSITKTGGASDPYMFQLLRLMMADGIASNYKIRGINGNGLDYVYTPPSVDFPNLVDDAAASVDAARIGGLQNRLIIFAGSNDIYLGSSTGAATYAFLTDYIDARLLAGWDESEIFVCTMLPRELNTAERQAYNNAIVADAGNRDYVVVPLHTNANIGDDGDQNNATYFIDTVHPTNAGHAIIAQMIYDAMFP